MRTTVDFLVIGAQKAGTTSVHRNMRAHPELFVPRSKEAQFFSHDHRFSRGMEWYMRTFFADAPSNALIGECSPHYMFSTEMACRIHAFCPDVKLIAILRHPIARARSHYSMDRRLGYSDKPFRETIMAAIEDREQLCPWLAFSEYGRILESYFAIFPRSAIQIEFFEDFAADPIGTMRRLYRFLGVDDEFAWREGAEVFYEGGQPRFPTLQRLWSRFTLAKRMARKALGCARYDALALWLESTIAVRSGASHYPEMDPDLEQSMVEYFREDVTKLETLIQKPVVWSEWVAEDGV